MPKGTCPEETIDAAFWKCADILSAYDNASVSISGGSDSDVMLDLLERIKKECKRAKCQLHYVFFDTGIEMSATKRHLDDLEQKYGIHIERVKAKVPVPLGCKTYGLPFLAKLVAENIGRLQNAGFDFKNDGNKGYEELTRKYKGCRSALFWWCDQHEHGADSMFNISHFPYLKDFLIENPPDFKISEKCCKGAKKEAGNDYMSSLSCGIHCLGLRKSEGGIRASSNTCFDRSVGKLKPIFWFDDATKEFYEIKYGVTHSDCYTVYGFKRTGCCGCPFNSRYKDDLAVLDRYEPKLANAARNIFGKSYEYTEAYKRYKEYRKKNCENQISLDLEVNE